MSYVSISSRDHLVYFNVMIFHPFVGHLPTPVLRRPTTSYDSKYLEGTPPMVGSSPKYRSLLTKHLLRITAQVMFLWPNSGTTKRYPSAKACLETIRYTLVLVGGFNPSEKWWTSSVGILWNSQLNGKSFKIPYIDHVFPYINHIYIIFQSTNQAWMVSKTSGVFSSCSLDVDPAKAVDEKRGVNGTNSQRDWHVIHIAWWKTGVMLVLNVLDIWISEVLFLNSFTNHGILNIAHK